MRFATNLTLKVPTSKLLATLKENKERHEKNYQEALTKFKKEALTLLAERMNAVSNGAVKDWSRVFQFNLPIPVSYVDAYDEVIKMLEFSGQGEIDITGDQYRAWVEDSWAWTHSFNESTMCYNGVAGLGS